MREKALFYVIENDEKTEKQTEANEDFDIEQAELKIQSRQAALYIYGRRSEKLLPKIRLC